ncbi:MAG: hypothetical protein WCY11_05805 [Novosphingobium sp.]
MKTPAVAMFALLLAAGATPAAAGPASPSGTSTETGKEKTSDEQRKSDAPKPVTDSSVSAADVATTPLNDLNLRKDDIPPILQLAQHRPYDLEGLKRCAGLTRAVADLDSVLGDDIDIADDSAPRPNAGKLAQWFVGSFIPFRGAIRELSGANAQQRRMQQAIQAGIARRSFLKGVGQARGCRYPARAASARVIAEAEARRAAEKDSKAKSSSRR